MEDICAGRHSVCNEKEHSAQNEDKEKNVAEKNIADCMQE